MPTDPTPSHRAERAEQDRVTANLIVEAFRRLQRVQSDADLFDYLSTVRRYDAARFAEGNACCTRLQEAYQTRQEALAAQKKAHETSKAAEQQRRIAYAGFRKLARRFATDPSTLSAVGLNGRVPADLDTFVANVRRDYAAAPGSPIGAQLASFGYNAAFFAAELAALDTLLAADAEHDRCKTTARDATRARDAHADTLNTFLRTLRLALSDRPDLRARFDAP